MPNFTIPSARHEPNFSGTRHSGWSEQGLEVYNEACKSIKKECQDAEKAAEFARQFQEAAILEKQGKNTGQQGTFWWHTMICKRKNMKEKSGNKMMMRLH